MIRAESEDPNFFFVCKVVVNLSEIMYDNIRDLKTQEEFLMSKTARMVMKIIGASLALAAFFCLLIGGWHDLSVGVCGLKERLRHKKQASEYDDYADEELYN